MTEFTASNGITLRLRRWGDISTDGGDVSVEGHAYIAALREFFQHERDEALGRWRWPENPDYVVYSKSHSDVCQVVNEYGGLAHRIGRGEELVDDVAAGELFFEAARAYFDAHPEPKSWHDAKPGEVWAITINGREYAATREYGPDFKLSNSNLIAPRDERITAGRRIWPEGQ